ncbi:hypothetical protein [Jiangella alkaliphila]|uniref:Uncharacterized protein n=1 Tax=Jiangella alkaliphila TaxID=419479 RepID=A0A1H2LIC9_9ACTN|nr:hypothetical protein [Jiangella alkaliphila]SDU80780.1 hypothetical protein SAMN04488563_6221 [Jiangella alkaliphila]
MQDARTVPVAGDGAGLIARTGWLLLLAMVWLTLAVPLGWLSEWDPGEMWDSDTRGLAIGTVVLGVLLVVLTARTVHRLPGSTARREIVVDGGGLLVTEHPKWWHRGGWARIGWDGVQVVNAPGPGELLELYLDREVPGLPAFAATDVAVEADTEIDGVRIPAPRLRLGEPVSREVAEAVAAWRPDLFYAGSGVDQWFTPPEAAGPRAVPLTDVAAPPEGEAAPAPPDVPRPAGPVWLEHGESWPRVLAAMVVQVAVLVGGIYLMNDPFGLPTAAAALIALVLLVPVLFCCITLPASLWLLPRFTAGVGILVSADGLELVRKRRWRPRALVRTSVSWDWVQVAVTRRAFDLATPARGRRVVDVYLHENARLPVPVPGVGADVTASRHEGPDAIGTGRLVRYPAIRLRLSYRHDLEARGRERWSAAVAGGRSPVRLPSHQLRPALLAFRPDLCHGFDDLWRAG